MEMRRAVWGLPHARIKANKLLQWKLTLFGYCKSIKTQGLWFHETQPIMFNLVVDNFSVKNGHNNEIDHLISEIIKDYNLTKDWTGNLFWGITLDWDYVQWMVDVSMPGYIKKKLQE